MVDKFAFRSAHYYLVHPQVFPPILACWNIAHCVVFPSISHRIPLIPSKLLVIFRVNDCVFTLRKRDFAKCVAVAQFSITKHQPYTQPEDNLRQEYLDLNRSHQSSIRKGLSFRGLLAPCIARGLTGSYLAPQFIAGSRFEDLIFDFLSLSFDFAQDGEPVEPFSISIPVLPALRSSAV